MPHKEMLGNHTFTKHIKIQKQLCPIIKTYKNYCFWHSIPTKDNNKYEDMDYHYNSRVAKLQTLIKFSNTSFKPKIVIIGQQ